MKNLNATTLKPLIVPLVTTLVIIIAIFTVGNLVLSQITQSNNNIASKRIEANSLQSKVDTLKEVNQRVTVSGDAIFIALPFANSATNVLSQVRKTANEYSVTMQQLQLFSASPGENTLAQVKLNFEATSEPSRLVDFILALQNLSPLVNLDSVLLKNVNNSAQGEINVTSFWAERPVSLPAISESVEGLTEAQIASLDTISRLIQPQFSTIEASLSGTLRSDPFSANTVE